MNPTTKGWVWIFSLLLLGITLAAAEQKMVVHEWGTFTSLQDETGEAIGGINTDDEPVPPFVHRLAYSLLIQPTEIPGIFCQGAPRCHPDVTMRLETPVIYFHPPTSQKSIRQATVRVEFHGGWLSEFYPAAEPDAPDLKEDGFQFGPLRSSTISKLAWNGLRIGGDWTLSNTTAHVWTSPRAVSAALVQTTNGQSEKFLFYRGVAHLDAPLRISRDANTDELVFRGQLEMPTDKPLVILALWLVDIQAGGKIAFRSLPALTLQPDSKKFLARTTASFQATDFASDNLQKLKAALQQALLTEGLFGDEARALLNTWELSYFKSTGLRVFFIVPSAWTDFYLPLEISIPSEINRVMVGRIELVTPEQRKGLKQIANFSAAEILGQVGRMRTSFYAVITERSPRAWEQLYTERKLLADVIPVPPTYQTYLDLGRFRNALILNEAKKHWSPRVTNFISTYNLQAYQPLKTPSDPKNY